MNIKRVKGYLITSFFANDNVIKEQLKKDGVELKEAPEAVVLATIMEETSGKYVSTVSLIPFRTRTECAEEKYNELKLDVTDDFTYRFVIEFSNYEFLNKKNAAAVFEAVENLIHLEMVGEKKKLDDMAIARGEKKKHLIDTKKTLSPAAPIMLALVNTGYNEELEAALDKMEFRKLKDSLYISDINDLLSTARTNGGLKFI